MDGRNTPGLVPGASHDGVGVAGTRFLRFALRAPVEMTRDGKGGPRLRGDRLGRPSPPFVMVGEGRPSPLFCFGRRKKLVDGRPSPTMTREERGGAHPPTRRFGRSRASPRPSHPRHFDRSRRVSAPLPPPSFRPQPRASAAERRNLPAAPPHRHARTRSGHLHPPGPWMAGTSPAMTGWGRAAPAFAGTGSADRPSHSSWSAKADHPRFFVLGARKKLVDGRPSPTMTRGGGTRRRPPSNASFRPERTRRGGTGRVRTGRGRPCQNHRQPLIPCSTYARTSGLPSPSRTESAMSSAGATSSDVLLDLHRETNSSVVPPW